MMMGFHCERVSMFTFFARLLRLIAAESELRLQFLSAAFRGRRKIHAFSWHVGPGTNVRDNGGRRGWFPIISAVRSILTQNIGNPLSMTLT